MIFEKETPSINPKIKNSTPIPAIAPLVEFSEGELTHLYHALNWVMDDVRKGNFSPSIIYKGEKPVEFSSIPLTMMDGGQYQKTAFDSVSQVLERYYAEKNAVSRIHQKSTDLRKIISNALAGP